MQIEPDPEPAPERVAERRVLCERVLTPDSTRGPAGSGRIPVWSPSGRGRAAPCRPASADDQAFERLGPRFAFEYVLDRERLAERRLVIASLRYAVPLLPAPRNGVFRGRIAARGGSQIATSRVTMSFRHMCLEPMSLARSSSFLPAWREFQRAFSRIAPRRL